MAIDQPDKSKRYDRQLRVWGQHGQQRLEAARILLLNCGPTGSETLKNLVLGGIGAFTIADGSKVQTSDLGNNYLVHTDSLGESRAKVVTELLQELNSSVSGSYVEESPERLIENPRFFEDFHVVVATQMREAELIKLDAICREKKIVLLIVRSYGLVGYLRASVEEHCIVESKPDNQLDDLRLLDPWPALAEFADTLDLTTMDDVLHKHVPYVVLLLKALAAHRAVHEGKRPTNKDQTAFREVLDGMRRRNEDGIFAQEENFDEAWKSRFHAWAQSSIPVEVRSILQDESINVTRTSDEFWILAAALKAFVENEGKGQLPLEGSIPDMMATTELYLMVQRLYREQADLDVGAVEAHCKSLLRSLGRPEDSIPRDKVKLFCKNARNLRLIRYTPLQQETLTSNTKNPALQQCLTEEISSVNSFLYVLLRAVDRFFFMYGRYPGVFDSGVEEDVAPLKNICMQLLSESGVHAQLQDDYISEMCRFGAGELHVVAAVMGGMAAQEIIKLVTKQFVPITGTLIYNAMGSTTSVLDL